MSETMQALVLHAVGDARYEAIPRPEPGPNEVLIQIGCCGVCGSDIPRVFSKGTYRFPTVCGHEFAGTVAECGPGVHDMKPGDRVAVFPLLWCGKCAPCERGQYVQCENYDYLGSRSDGGFAEYVVAQWARAMGASQIILCDIMPQKLDLAKTMGFTDLVNSREADPVKAIEAFTAGQGAHLCIEAAGVPQTTVQALSVVRRGGRMVLLGNPSADVSLPASLLSQAMRREVSILGTWNSVYSATGGDDDWHTVLEAIASKKIDLVPLITHRVSLDQSFDALRMIKEGREFSSKVLIAP